MGGSPSVTSRQRCLFREDDAGTGHRDDEPADATLLPRGMTSVFEFAVEHLVTDPVRWQKAPVGPDAHRSTKVYRR